MLDSASASGCCVITGAGSGIGRAAAHAMASRGYDLVLVGRTPSKLEGTAKELAAAGVRTCCVSCDLTDAPAVQKLARNAAEFGGGAVDAVLHIAGMSPHMGDAGAILRGNALATVHVHDAFLPVMREGGCVVDTSSMSAYLTPRIVMPRRAFALAQTDREAFMRKMTARVNLFPAGTRPGVAYAVSKFFVIEYAKMEAARFGQRGVRVLSVTPGNFDTPMGDLEKDEAGTYTRFCAIKRVGRPEEIAALYSAVTDPTMGYLTGTDILCDGGCVAGGASALAR